MKVISVLKGTIPKKIIFRHYGLSKDGFVSMYMPQYYEFHIRKPYIVFAKQTEEGGVLRQLWKYHHLKFDQGVIRAADAKPISKNKPIKEIIWTELIKMLESNIKADVIYAVGQLDDMSRSTGWKKLDDFDRNLSMEKIHSFVLSKDPEIAKIAITAIGNDSPYFSENHARLWLSYIGGSKSQGYAKWDQGDVNTIASRYCNDLLAVINGSGPIENRVLAIRSLGLVKKPEIFEYVKKWINDKEPRIRQAAVILLSDYPENESSEILTNLSEDNDAGVRYAVAQAIGFGQKDVLLPLLDKLINDKDIQVGSATVESILSFEPSKMEELLKKYKDNPDLKPLFVNALARVNAFPYLDDLAQLIKNKSDSKYFRGGIIPSYLSWKILFKFIQAQREETIKLGTMDKYLDALEELQFFGSSEPRDLYAFYIHYGLNERAKEFRAKCR